jgi:outer membrane protein assembly factor BamA
MKKAIFTFLLVITLFLGAESKKKEKDFILFPMGFYSPDTSLALGASFVQFQTPFPDLPNATNMNFGIAYVTLKKQFVASLSSERYLKNRDTKGKIEFGFLKSPDDFYGIGQDTDADLVEKFTPIEVKLKLQFKRRVYQEFFAGFGYRMHYVDIVDKKEMGLLSQDDVLGNEKSFVSALGISLDCDRTNDSFFPSKGFQLQFHADLFHSVFGSDYHFRKLSLEYRRFFPIFQKHVIGYQMVSENTFGDVPFSSLPRLGGADMMRGYAGGRYTDKKYLALQTELRLQLYKRLGMVIFGGIGEVAENFSDFQTKYLRFAGGMGLRFRLRKQQKLNFRIDFGIAQEEIKMYLTVREAF